MKVSVPQDEAPVERVGGILPSCPWKEVESCDCHGLGEGKECDYRQEMYIHRKGTVLLVSVSRTSAFPIVTTSAFYLL